MLGTTSWQCCYSRRRSKRHQLRDSCNRPALVPPSASKDNFNHTYTSPPAVGEKVVATVSRQSCSTWNLYSYSDLEYSHTWYKYKSWAISFCVFTHTSNYDGTFSNQFNLVPCYCSVLCLYKTCNRIGLYHFQQKLFVVRSWVLAININTSSLKCPCLPMQSYIFPLVCDNNLHP